MKPLFILTIMLTFAGTASAQTYLGVHSSNYDPLKTVMFNPATPAASLMKWEVGLLGVDINAAQDYLKLTGRFRDYGDFDRDENIEEKLNGKDKSGNMTADFQALSFMVNTKQHGAFTFYLRNRSILDFESIDEDFLTSIYNDVNNIYNWAADIEDDYLSLNTHSFSEIALGYSRKAFEIGEHSLTVGGTIKLLSPIASGKLEGSVDIMVDDEAGTANFGTTDISAITSEIINFADNEDYDFKYKIAGFSMDVGAVYEWKTGQGQAKVVGKNKNRVKIQPDYFIKAGFGLTDMGTIKHQHSVYSRSFMGDNSTVDLEDITSEDSSFVDFDEVLDALGTWEPFEGSFKSKLPLAMTLFADVKLTRGIYVNVSTQIGLGSFTSDRPLAKLQNIYSITPRFELPAVGIQMPMSFNKLNGFEMGASIRAGQVVIGSSNIFSWLWSNETSSVDIQLAVAFGVVDKTKKRSAKDSMDEQHRWMETGENEPGRIKKNKKKDGDGEGEELIE
jgi:hypothetical protein